ncbi:MAG: GGDEF domain-containing protein [Clostridia bacterium]|nr:GGDEF domain-containing protein [Clostridia bacterium]
MKSNLTFQIFRDFMNTKVPQAGRAKMPNYYRRVLVASNFLLALLFLAILLMSVVFNHHVDWIGIALLVGIILKSTMIDEMNMHINLLVHAVIVLLWSGWYVHAYGWNSGGQHFLTPLLMLIFFSVYVRPGIKVLYFCVVLAFRILLFNYTLSHEPVVQMEMNTLVIFQTVNTLFMFIITAVNCIVFSTSIQETERQLLIDNQELQHEAETDALTQLPNRRSIFDEMTRYMKENPESQFCIAIADIDFFKKVNDTYGHNCGDYTLRELAACFRENAGGRYSCGRWGGEEFCFFFPGMNIDDAGMIMRDVNIKVSYREFEFEGTSFRITITAGVEEYDFRSELVEIIEQADRKLYVGKTSGRNCVIV